MAQNDPFQQDQTTTPGPQLSQTPSAPTEYEVPAAEYLKQQRAAPAVAAAAPAAVAPAAPQAQGQPNGTYEMPAADYLRNQKPSAGGGTLESGLRSFIDAQDRPLQGLWNQGGVLGTAGGVVGSAAFGAEKSALRTLWDVGGLGQKAWNSTVGNVDPNAKVSTFDDDPDFLQSHGITESVGAGAEQIAEFLLGETALKAGVEGAKGLSVAQKLSKAAKEMELVEDSPRMATALRLGIGALRSGAQAGTVGTGLALLHGASAGQALESGATTGILVGLGLGLPAAAAADPEAILDVFKLPKTIANVRLASQAASTLRFGAGAAFTVPQGFNALVGQQEGETPEQSEQRQGEAAVQAALGFWAMKDALSEGNDLAKAAAQRQGEVPGETDILRTRFPLSATKAQREEVTEAWGKASPYLSREAQGEQWKTNPWKFWQDKSGEVDRAAKIAESAKWRLRDSQIVPVEQHPAIKDVEGDVSPVAAAIRASIADEDPTTKGGQERIEEAQKYAAQFEGEKMSVTDLSKAVKKLTDDRRVSGWLAKNDQDKATLLNRDPILEERVKALGALRKVLINTISDAGGEKVGNEYRNARVDFGYLSEVQHMLEDDVRSPTKSGIVEKMANIIRFYNFPKSTIHGNLMGEFRNPDRTVAQAFRDVNKFVPPAGEAVGPTIQTSMLTGLEPGGVGSETLEGKQAVIDPGELHALVYDSIQKGQRFPLSPDQTRVWYQNFKEHPWPDQEAGGPEQQLLNPLTQGHAPVAAQIPEQEDADQLRADFITARQQAQDNPTAANLRALADVQERLEKPAAQASVFGQTATPISPFEWSDERLRKISDNLQGWIDIRKRAGAVLEDAAASNADKQKAQREIDDAITNMFKGNLPPEKAAEVKATPTASEANASLQDVIDHLEAKIDAARSAAKSAAPEEKTEKNVLLNKAVQELITAQKARDSLTAPKEAKSPKGNPVGPKAATGKKVTLYRAQQKAGTGPGIPDWIRDHPEAQASFTAEGKWWTADPKIAQEYADRFVGPNAEIVSRTVSADEANAGRIDNLPADHPAREFSADPTNEYFLEHEKPTGQATKVETGADGSKKRNGGGTAAMAGAAALGAAALAGKAQAQDKKLPDGMAAVGNIDVNHRPVIQNKDGSHSTIFSWTVPIGNGQWALVPSIADGKFLTPDGKMPDMTDQKQRTALYNAAIAQYKKTGQHLGIFKSEDAANKFAEATHDWMPTGGKEKVFLPKPKS